MAELHERLCTFADVFTQNENGNELAWRNTVVDELLQQPEKGLALIEVEWIGLVDEQHGVRSRARFRAQSFSIQAGVASEKVIRRTAKRSQENAYGCDADRNMPRATSLRRPASPHR
jgi:hypothetical protein